MGVVWVTVDLYLAVGLCVCYSYSAGWVLMLGIYGVVFVCFRYRALLLLLWCLCWVFVWGDGFVVVLSLFIWLYCLNWVWLFDSLVVVECCGLRWFFDCGLSGFWGLGNLGVSYLGGSFVVLRYFRGFVCFGFIWLLLFGLVSFVCARVIYLVNLYIFITLA